MAADRRSGIARHAGTIGIPRRVNTVARPMTRKSPVPGDRLAAANMSCSALVLASSLDAGQELSA